jgi:hypothetical protein
MLSRRTPLKRTAMKRSTLLRAAGPARASVPVLRPRKCANCREPFQPRTSMIKWCSTDCGAALALVKLEKVKAKAARDDRKKTRAQLEAMKTIAKLEDECRKIVQKIARIRDRNDGCISCHMGPNYSGQWHGSHYRAHGACSSLQFHLWNIHKSCAQCNLYKGGNKEGYIAGLLAKSGYGRERLEWLDCQPKSKRFDRAYLLRFKSVMGRRCRRLEKSSMKGIEA